MKKIRTWNRYKPYQIVVAFVIVIALAAVGTILLLQSHAASSLVTGVYEGYANTSGVASFEKETKTTVGIAGDYLDGTSWQTIESGSPASSWAGSGYQLQLGVDMLPNSGASLAAGATGAYNSYFTTLAQNLVADNEGNAILHIGWEWDQSGNPWYVSDATDATNFAAYWKQIVTSMRAVPNANFNYSWYFGDANGGAASAITNDAWPGSAYVSSLDLDLYDQTWTGSCGLPFNNTATTTQANCVWTNTILPALNGYAAFASANSEPMGFGEWGVITRSDGHGLGDDPVYITNMANWFKSNNVSYASYFDFNSGGNSVLSTYPNSLAAYATAFGSSGTSTSTPPPVVSKPSTPTNVSATSTSSNSVTVSWSASTDTGGSGLGGYYILRNGVQLTAVSASTTSFTDTSVSANTSYSYTIEAYDKTSPPNVSSASTAASVMTQKVPLPTAPTNVLAKANSATSVTVSWTASTDIGGPGLSGYNIYRGGVKINSSIITTTSYTDTTVIANTSYSYTVVAVDTSANASVASTAAITTTPTLPDTTPPSTPPNVKTTVNSSTSVTISWNASTDSAGGGGISGYYVLRSTNGGAYTNLAPVTTTSYTDTSVSASTTYDYEIVAFDAAGNLSTGNTAVSAVTPASTTPVTPPAAPVNVSASAVSSSQIELSWGDTSSGVTAFRVYKVGSSTPLADLSYTITSYGAVGLSASTSYSFYVVAYTGSVASSKSTTASATTQAGPSSLAYATGTITGIGSKCIDNSGGTLSNNNKIVLYSCNGSSAEKWTYNPSTGTIVNGSGYCLNVNGNGTSSGTLVTLYECNGTSAQIWSVKGVQGVAGRIVSPHSGLCLDDESSGTSNNNPIWIYSCNGTSAQEWTVN